MEVNEDFDKVTVEGIIVKQGQKVLMNLQLEKDIALSQLQVLSATLKSTFKQLGVECEVYTVYIAKFFE